MRIDSFDATIDGRTVELASDTEHIRGTVHRLNGADITNQPGSTWLNPGVNNITDPDIFADLGTFNNAGTYRKSTHTGTTDFDAGIVEVAFTDGFTPQAGQEFVLLVSAGLSGTPQLVVTGLAPGWQFTTQYDPATDEFKLTSLSDGVPKGGAPLSMSVPSFSPPPGGTEGKSVSATASGPPVLSCAWRPPATSCNGPPSRPRL